MSEILSLAMQNAIRAFMREEWVRIKQEEEEIGGNLMTVQATAELFNVHIQTVQYWKRQGLIVGHKMGHRTYFKREELMGAMKTGKIKAHKENKAATAAALQVQPNLFNQATG